MIATSVGYDVVFLIHVLAAVGTVVVFVAMRMAAQQIMRGAPAATQQARFSGRRNWAARTMHLLPITGLVLSLTGDSAVSLTKSWVGIGIACYLAASGHLEARTLPLERVVAEAIRHDAVASPERGRQLLRSIDVLLVLIALALVAMIVQF